MKKTDDADELMVHSRAFSELTDKARMTEQAFNFRDPWHAFYKGIEDPVKAVETVIVRAKVTLQMAAYCRLSVFDGGEDDINDGLLTSIIGDNAVVAKIWVFRCIRIYETLYRFRRRMS